ncbi:MAG: hypothetical protein M5R36_20055 [Deltaproteobacteria bacterium]|nr:hypothetical protein [Deltaproteobacteria bacterium]
MKLRLQPGSLRLRLSGDEAGKLAHECRVENTVCFGARAEDTLSFSVETYDTGNDLLLRYQGRRIRILISETDAKAMANGRALGAECDIDVVDGTMLHVVVERDLKA